MYETETELIMYKAMRCLTCLVIMRSPVVMKALSAACKRNYDSSYNGTQRTAGSAGSKFVDLVEAKYI
jgi:hypothetical protein